MSVGALERALLREFPAEDAEAWDRTGLTVGDPAQTVTKVAVALDPTVAAVREAASRGANVLVTHHPAFLAAPDAFRPAPSAAACSGAVVWEAASRGIALMSFHTALDVSPRAADVLPGLLSLDYRGQAMVPRAGSRRKGYGQLCAVRAADAPLTLEKLAARCTSVFARVPRVWGDFDRELASVVTATGSAGEVVDACVAARVDCLVCGEVKYHAALDAVEAGLAIIDLGHDTSELPLAAVLAQAVERAGVPSSRIEAIDQGANWSHPESTRL